MPPLATLELPPGFEPVVDALPQRLLESTLGRIVKAPSLQSLGQALQPRHRVGVEILRNELPGGLFGALDAPIQSLLRAVLWVVPDHARIDELTFGTTGSFLHCNGEQLPW